MHGLLSDLGGGAVLAPSLWVMRSGVQAAVVHLDAS